MKLIAFGLLAIIFISKHTAVYFEVYDGFEEAEEMEQPVHALTANLQFLFKFLFYYTYLNCTCYFVLLITMLTNLIE